MSEILDFFADDAQMQNKNWQKELFALCNSTSLPVTAGNTS